MAYRTLNPFTEKTIREFTDHTHGEVEAAPASSTRPSRTVSGKPSHSTP